MSALSPTWYIRQVTGSVDTPMDSSGPEFTYKANAYQIATCKINDTPGTYTNRFTEEEEVQIWIGNPATSGVNMFHGFITKLKTVRLPNRERVLDIEVTDWGSYLAAKRNFEKRYFKSKTAQEVLTDTLPSVTDGVDTLTGTNIGTIGGTIKKFYEGTSVKNVWDDVAENAKCDYFVSELLDLNAFLVGSKFLQKSGTTYKLQDVVSGAAHELEISHLHPYEFVNDVSQRIRNVIVTNGLMQTLPDVSEFNHFQTARFHDDINGKNFSSYYSMGARSQYDIDTVAQVPVIWTGEDQVGSSTKPSIKLVVPSSSFTPDVTVYSHNDGVPTDFNLTIDDWQEISFWVKNNLAGATVTSFKILLLHDGSNYWEKELISYVGSSWKFFRLQLPSTTSNVESYTGTGWTKTNLPTKINQIQFQITPTTGFNAGSSVSFAELHFYTLRRKSSIAAGNPPTQKIITDGTQTHPDQLQSFADNEKARLNKVAKSAVCTVAGNTDFKRPGYLVDVDFSSTLGTGRSGTGANGLRLDTIRHYLQNGIHWMDITLKDSFHRP